jgi:hypothetical protein
LAAHWLAAEGWRNGYLLLYNQTRASQLTYGPDLASPTLDPDQRERIKQGYRYANHHAVGLDLIWPLLEDSQSPPTLREKSYYLQVAALYRQFVRYPPAETEALIPLSHFPAAVGSDTHVYALPPDPYRDPADPYAKAYQEQQETYAWMIRQAIHAGQQLLQQFPRSRYGDDVLLALYELTGDHRYLDQLLTQFPQGDRAEEARVALFVAQSPPDQP